MASDKLSPPVYGSNLNAVLRVLGFLGLILLLTPVHVVYQRLYPDNPFGISMRFHRIVLRMLGFRIKTSGTISTDKPTLFVANHSSYMDIPVLGSLLPAAFIAKAEVASWPLFGHLAKLQNTVFVERRSTRVAQQRSKLSTLLASGRNLILFPEGTSSDGQSVLPFKSGLFSVMESAGPNTSITVQPISIACTALDGLPLTRMFRPFYAWYGDMTLVSHLWTVFKLGSFTINVIFHEKLSRDAFHDRKALAAYCQQQVAHGIEQCVAGRALPKALPVPQLAAPIAQG